MADPNVLPIVSTGAIVSNSATARDESANSTLPPPAAEILTPTGRIQPAGSGPDGAGQISGTNAVETPTQQNNPTVGTNATVRPISQTQAPTTYNNNGSLTQAQLAALQQVPGSGSSYRSPSAPVGGPGAGATDETGGAVPARASSPSPQYQARNQSYVYQAVQVISSFKAGKFEQSLKGILYTQQTANTTQTNAQQRETVKTTPAIVKTQQSRPASTSTQASVRAVDNAITASSQAAVVEIFSNVDALGNFTGNYNN